MQPKTIDRPPIDLAILANQKDLQTATFALG